MEKKIMEKKIMEREMIDSEISISKVQGERLIACSFEGSALGIGACVIHAITDLCNKDPLLRDVLKCGMLGLLDEIKEAEGAND